MLQFACNSLNTSEPLEGRKSDPVTPIPDLTQPGKYRYLLPAVAEAALLHHAGKEVRSLLGISQVCCKSKTRS